LPNFSKVESIGSFLLLPENNELHRRAAAKLFFIAIHFPRNSAFAVAAAHRDFLFPFPLSQNSASIHPETGFAN
jgi:hypothetical protein